MHVPIVSDTRVMVRSMNYVHSVAALKSLVCGMILERKSGDRLPR